MEALSIPLLAFVKQAEDYFITESLFNAKKNSKEALNPFEFTKKKD